MSAKIDVQKTGETGDAYEFTVTVTEGSSATTHQVTLDKSLLDRVTKNAPVHPTPSQLVKASFRFLLKREPKESILRTFNCKVISTYFSDYEQSVVKML